MNDLLYDKLPSKQQAEVRSFLKPLTPTEIELDLKNPLSFFARCVAEYVKIKQLIDAYILQAAQQDKTHHNLLKRFYELFLLYKHSDHKVKHPVVEKVLTKTADQNPDALLKEMHDNLHQLMMKYVAVNKPIVAFQNQIQARIQANHSFTAFAAANGAQLNTVNPVAENLQQIMADYYDRPSPTVEKIQKLRAPIPRPANKSMTQAEKEEEIRRTELADLANITPESVDKNNLHLLSLRLVGTARSCFPEGEGANSAISIARKYATVMQQFVEDPANSKKNIESYLLQREDLHSNIENHKLFIGKMIAIAAENQEQTPDNSPYKLPTLTPPGYKTT